MPFEIPAVWREPLSHPTHSYFCTVKTLGFNINNIKSVVYPTLESAIRPQPYMERQARLPTPEPMVEQVEQVSDGANSFDSQEPVKLITQPIWNDMVRNLQLSKRRAISLARMNKSLGLLDPTVRISLMLTRDKAFIDFFEEDEESTYCCDVK
jgi:hypothetical protein